MIEIRDLREDELPFLGEMLYAALDWRPDLELPPLDVVLAHPQAVIYHRAWGRAGDVALVAERQGDAIGLVWCRLFTEAEHGHGFVDEETPELAIAVRDGFRGQGVGRRLLASMHDRLRADGVERVALSVDAENPAKLLYASLGYADFEPDDGRGRMVLDLGSRRR